MGPEGNVTTEERQPDAAALAEEVANLRRALETRTVIDEAKGMLMLDFGLDEEGAIAYLKRFSHDSNTKLHDVAERIVEVLTGRASDRTSHTSATLLNDLQERLDERAAGPDEKR